MEFRKRIALLYLLIILTPVVSFLFDGFLPQHSTLNKNISNNINIEVMANDGDAKKVVPMGKSIGVNINIDGAMVMGTSEMVAEDNKKYSPAKDAGIRDGDIIKKVNDKKIGSLNDLTKVINEDTPKLKALNVEIERGNRTVSTKVIPRVSKEDNEYKVGAWVKDSTSGIGTLTFYDPETKTFGALGHGITDSDTGMVLKMADGNILSSRIISVRKGEKGQPGELKGVFLESGNKLGTINKNCECGLFGNINADMLNQDGDAVEILRKNEIKEGKAHILSNIEGNAVEKFDIEIQKVMKHNTEKSKSMVIKVTDNRLLEKTGGIVQGMSGSPIIQNDKIVGAVTHVFVNDPTKGYGIFIETMLDNAQRGY